MAHSIYVFDAYGTLFDVHSAVAREAHQLGNKADAISMLWRNKQLEYSWIRTHCGQFQDFWSLTEQALDFALESHGIGDETIKKALLSAYEILDCYDEVPRVLKTLKDQGVKTAILSNGTQAMLEAAINNAGVRQFIDDILTVETVKAYKACPQVYTQVTEKYCTESSAISFQSSNRWDIAGAKAFGFYCQWINRNDQPEEYLDLTPDQVCKNLTQIKIKTLF